MPKVLNYRAGYRPRPRDAVLDCGGRSWMRLKTTGIARIRVQLCMYLYKYIPVCTYTTTDNLMIPGGGSKYIQRETFLRVFNAA